MPISLAKPVLVLDLDRSGDIDRAVSCFRDDGEAERIICVAGPRESEAPGIYGEAKAFLLAAFVRL